MATSYFNRTDEQRACLCPQKHGHLSKSHAVGPHQSAPALPDGAKHLFYARPMGWGHGKRQTQFLVTSLYMCFSEVFAHAIVATIYFGWGAGYQYYALLFSTGIFLLPPGRIIQKFSSILIACIAFSGLFYYSSTHPPIYVWESPYLEIVNVSNIIFSSLFHAGFAY